MPKDCLVCLDVPIPPEYQTVPNSCSAATIFITVCQYGIPRAGPWLVNTMEVMFWIYISVSVLISAFLYLTLWSTQYVTLTHPPTHI